MAKGKYEKWITEEGLVLLEGWARDGLTDEQIAHNVGVSRSTLNDWKKRYPDILDALKKGKEVVDLQVENALLKRALGYEYEEITKESQWNEKTNKYELVITKSIKKRQAPDTIAQIFWLKNRRPDKWRDKQDVEHTGDMDLNIVIDYGENND
ncbi:helix-turn-helix domain-containing protein [Priestia megaterium]|jgi:DNA-binding XRE family transcriptional regulator|uniref:helix-turn-helix domain-containing protein n=1 Tax=Priestia megaterium TaxID=1404 RepID=UPI0021BE9607|nr:helix-turn-helix domain-containing protein [Priestia megaterium]MCT9852856.1 helix-turn-helix domain-containing protein [Priestia megaterium]MDF1962484.1 helix-turn-helix domain-containing protein [Priestia megaterium]